ncbi:MAG: hypothetical protein ACWA5U_00285 [bacterium]
MQRNTTLQDVEKQLEQLTEQAYTLFYSYRIKRLSDVCTVCCIDREEEKRLVSVTAKGVNRNDLELYANAAFANNPSCPDEFKHFLPCYLALLKDFDTPKTSIERTLSRLNNYQALTTWSQPEVQLLNDFVSTLFTKALLSNPDDDPCRPSLTRLLITFDDGGFEVLPFLQQWQHHLGDTALLHIKHLLLFELNIKKDHQLDNCLASPELLQVVNQWLIASCDTFCQRIEQCIVNSEQHTFNEAQLEELSWAYEVLMLNFHADVITR